MKATWDPISRANDRTDRDLESQEVGGVCIPVDMGVNHVVSRAIGAALFLLFSGCAPLDITSVGPVEARNLHPVQMTALNPLPFDPGESDPRPRLGIRMDWANLWLLSGPGTDAIQLDGEILRTEAFFRVPFGEDWTVGVGIPWVHASGGVLDTFIETWHAFFGLPQNLRNRLPKDAQLIQAIRRGGGGAPDQVAYNLDREELELGDIPIQLHKTLWRVGGMGVGLAGGLEFPTGSQKKGIGNGGVDTSIGGDLSFHGNHFAAFAWIHRVWVAQAARAKQAGLPYNDLWKAGLGGQIGLSPRLSLLSQLNFETSVLKALRNEHASKDQLLLWAGLRFMANSDLQVDLMVGEDLITDVSPDVTIHLSFRIRL